MTLMERKYKKNLRDDAKFRRFLMYLFLEAVFE